MDTNNPQNEIVIAPGADVVGSDGDKIGTVKEVHPGYMTVEKGWFFPSDHYIPASAIADANEDTVFLNVARGEALKKGWENPPPSTDGANDTSTDTPDADGTTSERPADIDDTASSDTAP